MHVLDKNLLEDGTLEESFETLLTRTREEPDQGKEHREVNAAQLMRFITAVEAGQPVPSSTLENLMHVFVDVLEGSPFDEVFPLPGRDRRGAHERAHQGHMDAWGMFVHLVGSRKFDKGRAYEELAESFSKSVDWAQKTIDRLTAGLYAVELATECQPHDCKHAKDEAGCAVSTAIAQEELRADFLKLSTDEAERAMRVASHFGYTVSVKEWTATSRR